MEKSTLKINLDGVIEDRPDKANQLLAELLDQPTTLSLTEMLLSIEEGLLYKSATDLR